ncbi:MAG: hypothetical protein AAF969_02450 [Bacteroidota bacterium]
MKNSLARIIVEPGFCMDCGSEIVKELMGIDDITNVFAYPMESLVVFQFIKANELSLALNKLMEMGHPPAGDTIKEENYVPPLCRCNGMGSNAA